MGGFQRSGRKTIRGVSVRTGREYAKNTGTEAKGIAGYPKQMECFRKADSGH
ncbi:hypothetical protein [uncultured Ruminococcus sp.]|uniref:hypothetical protein n=1 Tax=uncultured Ruminococcus sp. TaxID=165186 RepID=UPI00267618EA|nr:hypothetical protein [uncultured Ruminococcus sp.]